MNPTFYHAASISHELAIAAEAARLGADVLLSYWQKLTSENIHEKLKGDLVTAADYASEKIVSEYLRSQTPEFAVVAEEGTRLKGSRIVWFVDPLDGTTNFVQRFPVFAVSIGLVDVTIAESPTLLAGVVYNPVSLELFYAASGMGSFLNGKALRVADKSSFGDAMIATGFPRRYHEELPGYLEEFARIFPDCRAIRRAGSAALDLCWTAQGIFDGFWEHRLSAWDVAAGALIVEEAGGTCTDFESQRGFLVSGNIIGANINIHRAILERIRAARS